MSRRDDVTYFSVKGLSVSSVETVKDRNINTKSTTTLRDSDKR